MDPFNKMRGEQIESDFLTTLTLVWNQWTLIAPKFTVYCNDDKPIKKDYDVLCCYHQVGKDKRKLLSGDNVKLYFERPLIMNESEF